MSIISTIEASSWSTKIKYWKYKHAIINQPFHQFSPQSPQFSIVSPLLPRQMQELADDYQRALADISSLRAIYDTEIEGLTEELSQCKAAHGEERLLRCCWFNNGLLMIVDDQETESYGLVIYYLDSWWMVGIDWLGLGLLYMVCRIYVLTKWFGCCS